MGEFAEGFAVGQSSGNNGFGDNGSWIWILVIFALLGWGRNGENGGGGQMSYDIGKLATTNDVASGFSTSAIMSNQRDLQLGQAGLERTLCQGFNGLQASISDCCCRTQAAIADVKYANERNTCDIIHAIKDGNQRLIDIYMGDKIDALRLENQTLRFNASQVAQNQFITQVGSDIVNRLQPPPVPSYNVPNPYYGYGYSYGYGYGGNRSCGGCC